MKWLPIDTAHTDGRPVWVKGNNYGDPTRGTHCCWAYWDDQTCAWRESGSDEGTQLMFLIEWLSPSSRGEQQ